MSDLEQEQDQQCQDENSQKQNLIESAKMAEQSERYDDMVSEMVKVAKFPEALSSEERNLLSVAYKNVVGARRSSWRVISSMDHKDNQTMKNISDQYLVKISKEIETICSDVVKLIDDHLIGSCEEDDHESRTFYMKMKGDYYRYVAEVVLEADRKDYADKANEAYSKASEICEKFMKPPHPIRLGLALNYSVFYYEIQDQKPKACEIAKKAFDEAIKDMDAVSSKNFKDSSLIMQLLRDNLTLWSTTDDEADEEEEP